MDECLSYEQLEELINLLSMDNEFREDCGCKHCNILRGLMELERLRCPDSADAQRGES